MAIYCHPILAQFLRAQLNDRIQIRDSIPLGQMPIEMDLLFEPSVEIASLPYPYNHLGPRTIGEFKGAGDTADWQSVAQIESYACLYTRQQSIEDRSDLTLWVIASAFAQSFERYIEGLTPIGPGLHRGTLAQFPIYKIDLATLPITLETFPLLAVYKGEMSREVEVIRFYISHYDVLAANFNQLIGLLHPKAFKEVLEAMNIESLRGLDLDLPAILALFETKAVIENIGTEAFIENIGAKTLIENIGTRAVLETLLSSMSDEEKQALMDQLRQSQGNGTQT